VCIRNELVYHGEQEMKYECEDCEKVIIIPERKHWNGTWVCNECDLIRFKEDMRKRNDM